MTFCFAEDPSSEVGAEPRSGAGVTGEMLFREIRSLEV